MPFVSASAHKGGASPASNSAPSDTLKEARLWKTRIPYGSGRNKCANGGQPKKYREPFRLSGQLRGRLSWRPSLFLGRYKVTLHRIFTHGSMAPGPVHTYRSLINFAVCWADLKMHVTRPNSDKTSRPP